MIVCPNCNHQNPDGAVQCEACYTPLPTLTSCPGCGASVQADASFCGQCGFDLRTLNANPSPTASSSAMPDLELTSPGIDIDDAAAAVEIPDLIPPDPLVVAAVSGQGESAPVPTPPPPASIAAPLEAGPPAPAATPANTTQLQVNRVRLFHVQTNTPIEIPPQLNILHIGKPNDRIPPTIDVSGFPNSEIVSRVHANIRVEGDLYYIEDVGSSNGTYINNMPLLPGNRHRLRPGDRVALGKGDKVTFIFQSS